MPNVFGQGIEGPVPPDPALTIMRYAVTVESVVNKGMWTVYHRTNPDLVKVRRDGWCGMYGDDYVYMYRCYLAPHAYQADGLQWMCVLMCPVKEKWDDDIVPVTQVRKALSAWMMNAMERMDVAAVPLHNVWQEMPVVMPSDQSTTPECCPKCGSEDIEEISVVMSSGQRTPSPKPESEDGDVQQRTVEERMLDVEKCASVIGVEWNAFGKRIDQVEAHIANLQRRQDSHADAHRKGIKAMRNSWR